MVEPPTSFLCPIGRDIMVDPVTCTDGHSYDRRNIATWLAENNTSPATGLPLPSRVLIPNIALRNAIDEWEDAQQQAPPLPPARPSHHLPPPWSPPDDREETESNASPVAAAPSKSTSHTLTGADNAEGEIRAGASVLYVDAHGHSQPARVVAVHPGGSEDPEPYFTIGLDGGTERDTIRSRLRLVAPLDSPPQSRPPDLVCREEEEAARREAVARSRREAKHERRRR